MINDLKFIWMFRRQGWRNALMKGARLHFALNYNGRVIIEAGPRNDGPGSQFFALWTLRTLATMLKGKFQRNEPEYNSTFEASHRYDEFFHGGMPELSNEIIDPAEATLSHQPESRAFSENLSDALWWWWRVFTGRVPEQVKWVERDAIWLLAHVPDAWRAQQPFMRQAFVGFREPSTILDEVVIHIRRGDVSATEYSYFFTSDDLVLSRIRHLDAAMKLLKIKTKWTIQSLGHPSDFASFLALAETGGPQIELRLNEDPLEDFDRMVHARWLMTGKGYFSALAGMLNPNGVLRETWSSLPQAPGQFLWPVDEKQPMGEVCDPDLVQAIAKFLQRNQQSD